MQCSSPRGGRVRCLIVGCGLELSPAFPSQPLRNAPQRHRNSLAFLPVELERRRSNGWLPVRQERFILALEATGSVGAAARAVGMSRMSAYRLRERPGAASFAHAWDIAIESGQSRLFDYAMERAVNGVTTITVMRGGSVSVTGGHGLELMKTGFRNKN